MTPPLRSSSRRANNLQFTNETSRLIQFELYKVVNGLSSKIMNLVFPQNLSTRYPGENAFVTLNVKNVGSGTETLAHLGPKIWSLVPPNIKESKTLYCFKKEIKKWKTGNCPCRLCKIYIKDLGFVQITK